MSKSAVIRGAQSRWGPGTQIYSTCCSLWLAQGSKPGRRWEWWQQTGGNKEGRSLWFPGGLRISRPGVKPLLFLSSTLQEGLDAGLSFQRPGRPQPRKGAQCRDDSQKRGPLAALASGWKIPWLRLCLSSTAKDPKRTYSCSSLWTVPNLIATKPSRADEPAMSGWQSLLFLVCLCQPWRVKCRFPLPCP